MRQGEIFHVWLTKYALSSGIERIEVEGCEEPDMVRGTGDGRWTFYHLPDWHSDYDAAVARAEVMRKRRIESLKRQLAKLEAKKF